MSLLAIENLSLSINGTSVLSNVSLTLKAGEVLGIIGESGSGKSMTANAVMQLLPPGSAMTGAITLGDTRLSDLSDAQMTRIRGSRIGMVFQEPMTALNPVQTIGDQVAEVFLQHQKLSRVEARQKASETLTKAGLPEAGFARTRYPHELSGGQRQRVVIAMAIANKPDVIIADEPTTALDVTTQAQILRLLTDLVAQDGLGLILITHDLAVVAKMADQLAIMKAGEVVEAGETAKLIATMRHPYTRLLFDAATYAPKRAPKQLASAETILSVRTVSRAYPKPRDHFFQPRRTFRAVNAVSFELKRGESLGLVGESGCGKSTLTRALLGLDAIEEGEISIDGTRLVDGRAVDKAIRRKMQVVFQDPYGSFNPRHKVARLITEPFHLLDTPPRGAARTRAVIEALESVNLPASAADKYIHEFSGGQRQRIAIARALITQPALIILDEAVSALDVSIRAQILDLLARLADEKKLSYLFISHDLSVVRSITDRVLVMQKGEIVEEGVTEKVFEAPQHPYTQALLSAAPRPPAHSRLFGDN